MFVEDPSAGPGSASSMDVVARTVGEWGKSSEVNTAIIALSLRASVSYRTTRSTSRDA